MTSGGYISFTSTDISGTHGCQKILVQKSSSLSKFLTLTMMKMAAPEKKYIHCETAKLSRIPQVTGQKKRPSHGVRHPTRRRRPSMTALVIIAIALALLLAAVIVIGTTRLQKSINDQPPNNTTTPTEPGPQTSPPSTEPPGGDRGLSWCQVQGDGNCTLGVYQNLDSGQIRAQVFDSTCMSPKIAISPASACAVAIHRPKHFS